MPPRLLYLGDVQVESSYHGSALLYRLLHRYPSDRLRVVEGSLSPSLPARRLPGVPYDTLPVGNARALNTRFHSWYSRWLLMGARGRARRVASRLNGFEPEAVVTVTHGYSWVTAAEYAARAGIPLYLISHDDWPSVVAASERARVEREFGRVYRQAAARFCVSPFMVEDYERRYGAPAVLLLPSRGPDAPRFEGPAPRLRHQHDRVRVVFAGTINSPGYAALLRRLAAALVPVKGELVMFGPMTREQANASGLDLPTVRLAGMIPSAELLQRLRDEADILFVPMSFAPEDRANMRMGFPSKLTDYTAVGLPMLICGPPDCSAVRWATGDVAEVATSESQLDEAVARLIGDRARRLELARNAQCAGDRDFSLDAAAAIFQGELSRVGR